MTVNVPVPVTNAIDAVDAWFEGLGRLFLGKVSSDHPLLAGTGKAGWRILTKQHELIVVVDAAFPFSRPSCYLATASGAMPHVDLDGKLCLRNPELPGDPVTAVSAVVGLARKLLADIAAGSEDDDFEEDFGLYWSQGCVGRCARLLGLTGTSSAFGAWVSSDAALYGFGSRQLAERWWKHRFDRAPDKVRQMAIVALDRLPHPDLYPKTASELWELVDRRSVEGAPILRACLEQCPKELLVTLTGIAPSGRKHAASLHLARKLDDRQAPLRRRVIIGSFRGRASSINRLCESFDVRRLATHALDAAGSRLPYPERDKLARSQVAIVGCGALGSPTRSSIMTNGPASRFT